MTAGARTNRSSEDPVRQPRTGSSHDTPGSSSRSPDARPPVAVGILSYNRRDEVLRTVELVLRSDYPEDRLHVVVIDNASNDGTAEAVAARFGDRVEVLRLPRNEGAVARNHVLLGRHEPYVFTFDDDCAPETSETIARAVEFMQQHPDVGALCFTVVNLHSGRFEFPSLQQSARREIPGGYEGSFVVGAAMCFRQSEIARVGGYDPRFFWGAEEYALGLDMLYFGVTSALLDAVVAYHRQAPRALDRPRVRRVDTRNNILIAARSFPLPAAFVVALVQTARRALAAILGGNPRELSAVVIGSIEGLIGAPRILRQRRPVSWATLRHNMRWFARSLAPARSDSPEYLPAVEARARLLSDA